MCNNQPIKVFPQKVTKPKQNKNTAAYYQCLLTESLNGFHGKKITTACRNCKQNSPNLAQTRNNQIQLLMSAYEQMGECLKHLLTPLEND